MTRRLLTLGLLLISTIVASAQPLNFNDNWRFAFGDASDPAKDFGCGTEYFNYITKANSIHNEGPYSPKFNDSTWAQIDLPHDWVVDLPFAKEASHSHGYKTVGYKYPKTSVGWYRKSFNLPEEDRGKTIYIRFDGIFRDSRVWVNGFYCGGEPSGYASSVYDITDYLNFGDEPNVVCVRADATLEEGWFYEGAGIYRNVYLIKNAPTHVRPFGTKVNYELSGNYKKAKIFLDANIRATDDYTLKNTLIDADGKELKTAKGGRPIKLRNPHLWSTEDPYLYTIRTDIFVYGQKQDSYYTTIGMRDAKFDPDKGFILNGKQLKLKGVNLHQDLAGVGSGIPDSLQNYILDRLKWMGCNAIRTSHNPVSPSMLDACDRNGFLVVEENRQFGSSEENYRLLKKMIDRDFNHPCIVLWSVGNEEWACEWNDKGPKITSTMRDWCHSLDPTRLMTVSTSSGPNIVETADVAGYNYIKQNDVDGLREKYPARICFGSEETTGAGTRGIFFPDGNPGRTPAFNINPEAPDSLHHSIERGWKFYSQRPWTAGIFYWTGFDYRGEPNPLEFPATGSQFGIFDYCGFPKDEAFYLRAQWTDEPVLHIFPDWNLPGHEGQEVSIYAYSNFDEVELFVNGESVGRKAMPEKSHLEWKVNYVQGEIKAVGYKDGKAAAEAISATPSKPEKLRVEERRYGDVSVYLLDVLDADERFVGNAAVDFSVTLSEGVRLLGYGNGDSAFQGKERAAGDARTGSGMTDVVPGMTASSSPTPFGDLKTFSGRAMVLVKGSAEFNLK